MKKEMKIEERYKDYIFNWGIYRQRREQAENKSHKPVRLRSISTEKKPLPKIDVIRKYDVPAVIRDGLFLEPKGDPFAPFPYQLDISDSGGGACLYSGDGRRIAKFPVKKTAGFLPSDELIYTARLMANSYKFMAIAKLATSSFVTVYNGKGISDNEELEVMSEDLFDAFGEIIENTDVWGFKYYSDIIEGIFIKSHLPIRYYLLISEDKEQIYIQNGSHPLREHDYRIAVLDRENFVSFEEMLYTARLLSLSGIFADRAMDAVNGLLLFHLPMCEYIYGLQTKDDLKSMRDTRKTVKKADVQEMQKTLDDALEYLYDGAPKLRTLYEPVFFNQEDPSQIYG